MHDRCNEIRAVLIVFLSISWVFVALRCYTRVVVKAQFGADDTFAVVALVNIVSSNSLESI
jgi:hypothetical protein